MVRVNHSLPILYQLPGNGEHPQCPVFIDGEKVISLSGNAEEIAQKFIELIEKYIKERFSK
jgi:(E)-4-hydroxy-3-methylbut-2-enyl-diphosphate synthase